MATVPAMSVSHAGHGPLLIMLMTVHGTTPKYSSMEVQHWMALACKLRSPIQPSMTAPSLAIFMSAPAGMPLVEM